MKKNTIDKHKFKLFHSYAFCYQSYIIRLGPQTNLLQC